jgi:hypothetical protein
MSDGIDFMKLSNTPNNSFIMLNSVIPVGLLWAWLLYKDHENSIILIDRAEAVKIEDIITVSVIDDIDIDTVTDIDTDEDADTEEILSRTNKTTTKKKKKSKNKNNRKNQFQFDFRDNKVAHYYVEYLLGVAELFRTASSFLLFFLRQYMIQTQTKNSLDIESYSLISTLATGAMAIGNFSTIYLQNRDDISTNFIYWTLNFKNLLCFLVWLPYLYMPNTFSFGLAIIGFHVSYAGTYKLLPDLNNRLTYETTYGSNILILFGFLGLFSFPFIGLVWSVTKNPETFVTANIVSTVISSVLCLISKHYSYISLSEDEDDENDGKGKGNGNDKEMDAVYMDTAYIDDKTSTLDEKSRLII